MGRLCRRLNDNDFLEKIDIKKINVKLFVKI